MTVRNRRSNRQSATNQSDFAADLQLTPEQASAAALSAAGEALDVLASEADLFGGRAAAAIQTLAVLEVHNAHVGSYAVGYMPTQHPDLLHKLLVQTARAHRQHQQEQQQHQSTTSSYLDMPRQQFEALSTLTSLTSDCVWLWEDCNLQPAGPGRRTVSAVLQLLAWLFAAVIGLPSLLGLLATVPGLQLAAASFAASIHALAPGAWQFAAATLARLPGAMSVLELHHAFASDMLAWKQSVVVLTTVWLLRRLPPMQGWTSLWAASEDVLQQLPATCAGLAAAVRHLRASEKWAAGPQQQLAAGGARAAAGAWPFPYSEHSISMVQGLSEDVLQLFHMLLLSRMQQGRDRRQPEPGGISSAGTSHQHQPGWWPRWLRSPSSSSSGSGSSGSSSAVRGAIVPAVLPAAELAAAVTRTWTCPWAGIHGQHSTSCRRMSILRVPAGTRRMCACCGTVVATSECRSDVQAAVRVASEFSSALASGLVSWQQVGLPTGAAAAAPAAAAAAGSSSAPGRLQRPLWRRLFSSGKSSSSWQAERVLDLQHLLLVNLALKTSLTDEGQSHLSTLAAALAAAAANSARAAGGSRSTSSSSRNASSSRSRASAGAAPARAPPQPSPGQQALAACGMRLLAALGMPGYEHGGPLFWGYAIDEDGAELVNALLDAMCAVQSLAAWSSTAVGHAQLDMVAAGKTAQLAARAPEAAAAAMVLDDPHQPLLPVGLQLPLAYAILQMISRMPELHFLEKALILFQIALAEHSFLWRMVEARDASGRLAPEERGGEPAQMLAPLTEVIGPALFSELERHGERVRSPCACCGSMADVHAGAAAVLMFGVSLVRCMAADVRYDSSHLLDALHSSPHSVSSQLELGLRALAHLALHPSSTLTGHRTPLREVACDALPMMGRSCYAVLCVVHSDASPAQRAALAAAVAADPAGPGLQLFSLLLSCLKVTAISTGIGGTSTHAQQLLQQAAGTAATAAAIAMAVQAAPRVQASSRSGRSAAAKEAKRAKEAQQLLVAPWMLLAARSLQTFGNALVQYQAVPAPELLVLLAASVEWVGQHLSTHGLPNAAKESVGLAMAQQQAVEALLRKKRLLLQCFEDAATGRQPAGAPASRLTRHGSGGSGSSSGAVAQQQLPVLCQQFAQALAAQLPMKWCCNNPDCLSTEEGSEVLMVSRKKSSVCSGCCLARYCSKQCQHAHWKHGHKPVCQVAKAP